MRINSHCRLINFQNIKIRMTIEAQWADPALIDQLKESGCDEILLKDEDGNNPKIWTPGAAEKLCKT